MASDTVTVRYHDNDGFDRLLGVLHSVMRETQDPQARYSVDDRGDGVASVTVFGSTGTVDTFTAWLNNSF